MYSVSGHAKKQDALYVPAEKESWWLKCFGYWIGGAEMLTVQSKGRAFEVTSKERCKDHGCGRICYSHIGTFDEVLDYAIKISRHQHKEMRSQVARNVRRLRRTIGNR